MCVSVKNEQIMIFELLVNDNELLVGREVFNRGQNKQKISCCIILLNYVI